MDFAKLRYAVALAEELNFTRAARRCNISQPPLSRAIADLEGNVGVKLFERDKHHVSITAAGEHFVTKAKQVIDLFENCVQETREAADGMRGALTIGFGGSMVYSVIPSLIRQFRAKAPDVSLKLRAIPVTNQLQALVEGDLDIGILRTPVSDDRVTCHHIHEEPLVVALPDEHPLALRSGDIAVSELKSSPFVTYETRLGFNYHTDLLQLCSAANFNPAIAHAAVNTEGVIGIVACGEGVAIVPASAKHLSISGATFRNLKRPPKASKLASVSFALAWNRELKSTTARQFLTTFGAQP